LLFARSGSSSRSSATFSTLRQRSASEKSCSACLGQAHGGAGQGGETLAIAEGFETAGAYTRIKDIPCWASLGARRLDQLVIPPGITTLLIAEDNDPEGRRAAASAEAKYARPGLIIRRDPPPPAFKDWAKFLDAHCRT
jgi:hypothetical protein